MLIILITENEVENLLIHKNAKIKHNYEVTQN